MNRKCNQVCQVSIHLLWYKQVNMAAVVLLAPCTNDHKCEDPELTFRRIPEVNAWECPIWTSISNRKGQAIPPEFSIYYTWAVWRGAAWQCNLTVQNSCRLCAAAECRKHAVAWIEVINYCSLWLCATSYSPLVVTLFPTSFAKWPLGLELFTCTLIGRWQWCRTS